MSARKNIALFCAAGLIALSAALFAKPAAASEENGRVKVVAACFPEYDWAKRIIGDARNVELTLLSDNGVDLHSFQPSVRDIARISGADIFIFAGGESCGWAEDVLKSAGNRNLAAISLLDALGARAIKEDDSDEFDEHVWLSLRNARLLCAVIADALCQKDAQNAAAYRANLAAYCGQLDALDAEYAAAVQSAGKRALLFADRFPFRYLADDYGLSCYAAFAGCSAETEASFRTIAFLAGKMNELDLHSVCKIEGGDERLARTVIGSSRNKNAEIITFDSMQSVSGDMRNSESYLGLMRKNLAALRRALE